MARRGSLRRPRSRRRPRGRPRPGCARGSVISRISPPLSRTAASSARASAAEPPRRHLRLGRARQQRGDVMAEAPQPQIDLAQAVEEQQPGLHGRDARTPARTNSQRRERAHLEQPPAGAVRCQQRARARRAAAAASGPPARGSPRTIGTNSSCQRRKRVGIARAEARERLDGALRYRSTIRARGRRR